MSRKPRLYYIPHYDLIIDGSDNFKTRYLVNDICCQLNKSFISSSILGIPANVITDYRLA
ncbi:ThiF family adenylyltransferase [Legionella antarctica]|uniref:ThiF family adenylyltransferase n=1 Tax=Legionella antarctica TaxID=2708020 RepID=UPI001D009423|nr:ThiF family adenylyltransferase [Legionella antarctica]